jgi:hypothetical protein
MRSKDYKLLFDQKDYKLKIHLIGSSRQIENSIRPPCIIIFAKASRKKERLEHEDTVFPKGQP